MLLPEQFVLCLFLSNDQLYCHEMFFSVSTTQHPYIFCTSQPHLRPRRMVRRIAKCGFGDRETFGGENTALNKVLFLICLSLQETTSIVL